MSMEQTEPASPAIGTLLRYWRGVRRTSQLELAAEAMTTPRYVSFVETGRAQPSRQMVVRLARALDVPLRERNGLLLAAGYAPMYSVGSLDAPELGRVDAALTAMLEHHEPFPAVVMDRGWNVVRANAGATSLFTALLDPETIPDPANVLRLMIEPGLVQRRVANWSAVVPALLERARREAVGGVLDRDTAELVNELRGLPHVAEVLKELDSARATVPVLDVEFRIDDANLHFFSVVSTIGTPIDVTTQELRIEQFFPSDDATRAVWPAVRAGTAHV
jgi:transcriptional regulator with XRE-family HTH domain